MRPPEQIRDVLELGPGPGVTDAVVTARNLRKVYKNKVALDGTTFDIPAGRIVGLIGPNGAGKTTFVNMLMGALPPTSGAMGYGVPAGMGALLAEPDATVRVKPAAPSRAATTRWAPRGTAWPSARWRMPVPRSAALAPRRLQPPGWRPAAPP